MSCGAGAGARQPGRGEGRACSLATHGSAGRQGRSTPQSLRVLRSPWYLPHTTTVGTHQLTHLPHRAALARLLLRRAAAGASGAAGMRAARRTAAAAGAAGLGRVQGTGPAAATGGAVVHRRCIVGRGGEGEVRRQRKGRQECWRTTLTFSCVLPPPPTLSQRLRLAARSHTLGFLHNAHPLSLSQDVIKNEWEDTHTRRSLSPLARWRCFFCSHTLSPFTPSQSACPQP